jgi:hypothetical protein
MCRMPVTFGGGMTMTYVLPPPLGRGAKRSWSIQNRWIRSS